MQAEGESPCPHGLVGGDQWARFLLAAGPQEALFRPLPPPGASQGGLGLSCMLGSVCHIPVRPGEASRGKRQGQAFTVALLALDLPSRCALGSV